MRLLAPLLLIVGGCRQVAAPEPESAPGAWILVERPYGTLPDSRAGAAVVSPAASAWVLEPIREERAAVMCPHVLQLRSSLPEDAGVGESVAVELAFEGAPRCEHQVEIAPTRQGVEIKTPSRFAVKPNESVRIRFTASSQGRGGIAVRVIACRRME